MRTFVLSHCSREASGFSSIGAYGPTGTYNGALKLRLGSIVVLLSKSGRFAQILLPSGSTSRIVREWFSSDFIVHFKEL